MYLSLDTSTQNISLALVTKENIRASMQFSTYMRQSDELVFLIKTLMKMNSITWDDVEGVVVGSGPGSFTGLRVGFSVVKALLCTKKMPVWPVSSLYSIFYKYKEISPKVYCIKDALRGNFYAGDFAVRKGVLKSSVRLLDGKTMFKQLPAKKEYLLAGESIIFRQDIEKCIPHPWLVPCSDAPDAGLLALAAFQYAPTERVFLAKDLQPLYLYPEYCQIKGKEGDPKRHA